MQYFSFAELLDILHYKREQKQNEELLRAYEVSYSALFNISFADFKAKALDEATKDNPFTFEKEVKEIEEDIENYLNNFEWEEVT